MSMRVILTAGDDQALHVIGLGEMLLRDGNEIAAVLCVRKQGLAGLRRAVGRIVRPGSHIDHKMRGALGQFFQQNGVHWTSIAAWCRERRLQLHVVPSMNAPATAELMRRVDADGVIYGGGGILRKSFIDAAGGKVLNAHHGPLPAVRGMNACEWSLLLGFNPTVTIHYIDTGVDTGPPVEAIPIRVEEGDTVATLRGKCVLALIDGLRRNVWRLREPIPAARPDALAHKQVYALSPALHEILERRLASGRYASPRL